MRLHLKFVRLRRKWPTHVHLPFFSLIIALLMMIGMQAQIISGSGGVNLRTPYLFRDYGMPQAFTNSAPQAAQLANIYQQKSSSSHPPSQYSESEEVGSSEEEIQYTAPLILDIDDPEVKARWIGVTGQQQESYESDDDDDDEEYFEEGSMSSSEFSSRSSAQQGRSSGNDDNKNHENKQASETTASKNTGPSDESRGMLDNFKIMNPLSGFWGGAEDDTQAESAEMAELPQSDETPEYNYYEPYAYDTSPYYYDSTEELHDQKKPKPKPMGIPKPKLKPKPKPIKLKPSPIKSVKKPPKSKLKPKYPKLKRKKKKHYGPPPPQFHYPEMGKPDKLSIISEKLSKLNPFNYVQIKPPQITITKTYDQPPHPPPRRKRPKKGKKPKPPKRKPIKIKKPKPPPKPSAPSKKQIKKPKKPMDETSPEFEFYFGNPFGGYSEDDFKGMEAQYDYRQGDEEEEETNDEDDDDDDDEEDEEEEEEDDYYASGPMTVVHGQQDQTSAEEATEAVAGDDANVEEETETIPVEDDEADYGTQGGIPRLTEGEHSATATTPEDREKSIRLQKIIGWRKRRKPKPKKHKPARRPPNWKQYRPAPLLPEIPEGVHDAVLKVIKNVGFLPEYGKNEKYGGHNKIKGKFTKTRPITLHHGLLTEVLRRK